MPPRAAPLTPDQRRASIVAAATPLLLERGADLTTRDIAAAAGVAEGTVFKVFESKDAVVDAIVQHLLDPAGTCAEIAALDPPDLTTAVREIVALIQRQVQAITTVFAVLQVRPPAPQHGDRSAHEVHRERNERLLTALQAALQPWQHQLRLPVRAVASLVRSTAFATAHPMLSDGELTDPDDITAVLLHGLVLPRHTPDDPTPAPADAADLRETAC